MTVYIAGGACVLGPQFNPRADQAQRAKPHLCERTYEGGTPHEGGFSLITQKLRQISKNR